MAEELIGQFGYVGIALILILGGLGLPIPEEAPIILAAVLTRNGQMSALPALASCLIGVLLGDFVVYLLGFFYGEKVLSFPMTRRYLTRQREEQIKGYFHRHGFKILVSGRLVPGFRTAAYLTAGILKLPALRLLLTDLIAATISTSIFFGLGYLFANTIQKGIHEVQQWLALLLVVGVAGWLLHRYDRARRDAGRLVGPPVLDVDEVALPDLDYQETGADTDGPPPAEEGTRPAAEPESAADGTETEGRDRPRPIAGHPEGPTGMGLSPSASATLPSPSR